ncbi:MAG: HEAT repeat domain-containing protein [Polyangiaceae bacterium]|nr:HEAT repeat domain-containing protein [Polyangiaceae bacterium]
MSANAVERIAALLAHPEPERRAAAAIVLGELGDASPKVVRALCAVVPADGPLVQRHALEALAELGAPDAAEVVVGACTARDAGVREAALAALVRLGKAALPALKARMKQATPEEHRALETALARLGGKQALGALLASFDETDEEAAVAAAVAMRPQIREADARTRGAYLAELERFLARRGKEPRAAREAERRDKGAGTAGAVRAALKMVGYLEDERAAPLLLEFARPGLPAGVRQEALIALRFASAGKKADAKVVDALVKAAEDPDRSLAQTALMTLSGLSVAPGAAGRLAALLRHPEEARATAVAEMLARRDDEASVEALVAVVAEAEPRRAALAAHALAHRDDAAGALAAALAACEDAERARLIADLLRPLASKLSAAAGKKLLDHALDRLTRGDRGWEAALEVARDAAPALTAERLRDLAHKLGRGKPERASQVLRLLCRSELATDADRWALAMGELERSPKDVARAAREGDEALALVAGLLRRGFDVLAALRRDRSADLDTLYYLGFHFAEQGEPTGNALLRLVVERAGRAKIGRMARNKLELAGGSED